LLPAGDDLLRSKSLDRDSYNSGDWFNRVDWTGGDNNFGAVRGLSGCKKEGAHSAYTRLAGKRFLRYRHW
jgi:pullulanase